MCQYLLFSITIACIISHEKALKLLTNKKLIEILTNLYEAHLQVKNVTIYIKKNLPMAFIFEHFRQICLECTAVAYINQIPFRLAFTR